MRYVHFEEDVGNCPKHQIDTFKRNIYGLILSESHPKTSMKAWELAVELRNKPDDVDLVFKAIYFIRDNFKRPISLPHNHYNAETFRELFADIERVSRGLPRYKSVDSTIALLEKEDLSKPKLESSRYYNWSVSQLGLTKLCSTVDNIVDMLCTISALTKLLQK